MGWARAETEANIEAERRWAGITAQGADAVEAYSQQVADQARVARIAADAGQEHITILGGVGKSSSAAAFAVRDLGLQSIDLFQGIATGQPILRTFLQQGAQTVQVASAMNVSMKELATATGSALASGTRALISPAGLATAGIAALGAAAFVVLNRAAGLEDQQRQLAVSLAATGRSAPMSPPHPWQNMWIS